MKSDEVEHFGGDLWGPLVSRKAEPLQEAAGSYSRKSYEQNPTAIFDRDGPLNSIHDFRRDNFLREERGSQTADEFVEAVHGNIDRYGTREGFHIEDMFQSLKDSGYQVAVVTNQPDIFKHDRLQNREETSKMNEYLLELGADIVVACPHPAPNWDSAYAVEGEEVPDRWPEDTAEWRCSCHKPETGMFSFLDEFIGIDYSESFMVGDSSSDLRAAFDHSEGDINALYFIEEYPLEVKTAPEIADESLESTEELHVLLEGEIDEEADITA